MLLQRHRPTLRGGKLLTLLAALSIAGIVLLAGCALGQTAAPSTPTPPPPTLTSTPPPTDTPEPTPTLTPPLVVVKPEDAGPNPAASEIVDLPTPRPTVAGPPILPNGVRYGDREPDLPNRIVRISSPDIKLDTTVYEVYATDKGEWEVAEYAAGHHYNSLNPGDGGNIVLSGHNNWRGEVFRYLEKLQPGNLINVWTLDGTQFTYAVEEVEKLKEAGATLAQRLSNGQVMKPTPQEQLTLITCWPYTTFTHRLIVIAKPVSGSE